MNNSLYKKMHTASQEIRLTDAERTTMYAAIGLYLKTDSLYVHSQRTTSKYQFFFMHPAMSLVALALIVLVSAGGTAYAAEGSLPGDLLYPVKISVNEKIQTALAVTPRAKAQVHTMLAERRVDEARQLAQRGVLSTTTTQELQNNFSEHSEAAHSFVAEIAKSDPAEANHLSVELASSTQAGSVMFATSTKDASEVETRHSENRGVQIIATPTPTPLVQYAHTQKNTERQPEHDARSDEMGETISTTTFPSVAATPSTTTPSTTTASTTTATTASVAPTTASVAPTPATPEGNREQDYTSDTTTLPTTTSSTTTPSVATSTTAMSTPQTEDSDKDSSSTRTTERHKDSN